MAAYEPVIQKIPVGSFLDVILQIIGFENPSSTITGNTIFNLSGKSTPTYPPIKTKIKTEDVLMSMQSYLKIFNLSDQLINTGYIDITTSDNQKMLTEFCKILKCGLIIYIFNNNRIDSIRINELPENNKIILCKPLSKTPYTLYTDSSKIPYDIRFKISLIENQREQEKKMRFDEDAKASKQIKKQIIEILTKQIEKLEFEVLAKQIEKQELEAYIKQIEDQELETFAKSVKEQTLASSNLVGLKLAVSEESRAVSARSVQEAHEQSIAGWRCDKCFYINPSSHQTCRNKECGNPKTNPLDISLLGKHNRIYILTNNGRQENYTNHCMLISILMFLKKNGYHALTLRDLRNTVRISLAEWNFNTEFNEDNIVHKEILRRIEDEYKIVIIIYDIRKNTNKCSFIDYGKDAKDRTKYKKCIILQEFGHFSLIDLKNEYPESIPTKYEKFPLLQQLSLDFLSQFKGGNLDNVKHNTDT
jgi:hypothetical protein